MTQNQQNNIDAYASGLKKLEEFLNKYNVPEEFSISVSFDRTFQISRWLYDNDRDEVLPRIADVFGTEGWTATEDGRRIDWTRTIDDIKITLYAVDRLPDPQPRPVAPREWPLQLTATAQ